MEDLQRKVYVFQGICGLLMGTEPKGYRRMTAIFAAELKTKYCRRHF